MSSGTDLVAATLPDAGAKRLPEQGRGQLGGRELRVAGFQGPAFDGGRRPGAGARRARPRRASARSSLEVIGILAAALIAAFAFAITVSRSLQAQIQRLLEAARALAGGDFGVEVPTEGNDEFAALGTQFNTMARQLERRLDGAASSSARGCARRSGASASRSPRGSTATRVLEIVVQTAVDGVGADCGRAAVRAGAGGRFDEVAGEGDVDRFRAGHRGGRGGRARRRRSSWRPRSTARSRSRTRCAPRTASRIARHAHRRARRPGLHRRASRSSSPTSPNQAGVSIENVDLHETVSARRSPTSSPACSTTAASRR